MEHIAKLETVVTGLSITEHHIDCICGKELLKLQKSSASMAITCGIDIFTAFRRLGYASNAVSMALEHAKSLGYKIAVASVRKNNIASIALHKKLKFEIDHEYINSKVNEVYFFLKAIY